MAKVDDTNWEELVDLAVKDLRDCPFCHSQGREIRLEPKGQTWLGMGYSAPQYWQLTHFCEKPDDDPFVNGYISFRVRDLDDAIKRWNALS